MLEPHRRAHLRIWSVLAVGLPLVLLAAYLARPRSGEGQAPQRLGDHAPLPAVRVPA